MKCMDELTRNILFKGQEGQGRSAITRLMLAAGGSTEKERKNRERESEAQSKTSFHTRLWRGVHAHTVDAEHAHTPPRECGQNAALFHCRNILLCMRKWVCVRAQGCALEAVSLSSPSGVIKARTSHPERSPFLTHSVLPPSDRGPPSNLLHKTSSTNCTLPVGAARPIKVSYLVPIIPSCPPYKRWTLHG